MVTMENAEEVMQILERFTRLKQKEIPKELDDYLGYVAKTGDTVFKWPSLKYLFREKLLNVIKHFHDTSPRIDEIPPYPNVDPFNYESMKSALLERLELFNAAPFTIQRLCELLIDPRKQYSRIDKFMRALEKNILVVSTVEPGRKRAVSENGDSLDSMVNGDLSLDVNVDIDMEADSLFSLDGGQHVNNENASNNIVGDLSDKSGEFLEATTNIANNSNNNNNAENSENHAQSSSGAHVVMESSTKLHHVLDEQNRLSTGQQQQHVVLNQNTGSNATTTSMVVEEEEAQSNDDDTSIPHPKKVKLDLPLTGEEDGVQVSREQEMNTSNDQSTNNELPKSSTDTSMEGTGKVMMDVKKTEEGMMETEKVADADNILSSSSLITAASTSTTTATTTTTMPETISHSATEKATTSIENQPKPTTSGDNEAAKMSAGEHEQQQGKEAITKQKNENNVEEKANLEEEKVQVQEGSEEGKVSLTGTPIKKQETEEEKQQTLQIKMMEDEKVVEDDDQAKKNSSNVEKMEMDQTKQFDTKSATVVAAASVAVVVGSGQETNEKEEKQKVDTAAGILIEQQESQPTTIEMKKNNLEVNENINETPKKMEAEEKMVEKSNDDIDIQQTKAKTEISSEQQVEADSDKQKTDEQQQQQLLLLQKIDETISKSESNIKSSECQVSPTLKSIVEEEKKEDEKKKKEDATIAPQMEAKPLQQSENNDVLLPITPTKVDSTPTPTPTPTQTVSPVLVNQQFEDMKNVVSAVASGSSMMQEEEGGGGANADQMLEMVAEETEAEVEAQDVPIDEEADVSSPPLDDEVVMAEEPPLTTTNLNNGADGVNLGIEGISSNQSPTAMATEDESPLGSVMVVSKMSEEEPAGMDVDDTSQEAMDQ